MTVEWDLWNEPNLAFFWIAPQSQYLEMWSIFYKKVRAAFPHQLIVGPSTAGGPESGGSTWWDEFLSYAKSLGELPDIYSWHDEPGSPVAEKQTFDNLLTKYGITNTRPVQINEYGILAQQNPGGGVWFISQLSQAGADGLQGNWAGGQGLHNDMANLLTQVDGQYEPLAEWWVFRGTFRTLTRSPFSNLGGPADSTVSRPLPETCRPPAKPPAWSRRSRTPRPR